MYQTELTEWFCKEIVALLHERHSAYLQEGERFEVSGYHSPDEAYAKFILHNADDSFYYPAECKISLEDNGLSSPEEALDLVLDFQDDYFSRYLHENRELFLPIDWASFQFGDYILWTRGQILNRHLEDLADRLLSGQISPQGLASLLKDRR